MRRRRQTESLRLQISPAEIPFEIMRARRKNQKAGVKCSVTTLRRPLGPRDLIRRRTQRKHDEYCVCGISLLSCANIRDHSVVIMSAVLPTHHRRRRHRRRAAVRSIHICSSTLALFEQIFIAASTHESSRTCRVDHVCSQPSTTPENLLVIVVFLKLKFLPYAYFYHRTKVALKF